MTNSPLNERILIHFFRKNATLDTAIHSCFIHTLLKRTETDICIVVSLNHIKNIIFVVQFIFLPYNPLTWLTHIFYATDIYLKKYRFWHWRVKKIVLYEITINMCIFFSNFVDRCDINTHTQSTGTAKCTQFTFRNHWFHLRNHWRGSTGRCRSKSNSDPTRCHI